MFFFFIGGVQPKEQLLDPSPRTCPNCGREAARLKSNDSYLSLFFIPLFPVRRGEPMLVCEACGYVAAPERTAEEQPQEWFPEPEDRPLPRHCPACGEGVEPGHRYCPRCGQRL